MPTVLVAAALATALTPVPARAASDRDHADCEQVTQPSLKISACTRILTSANLNDQTKSFAHYNLGLGLLLKNDFDRAIVEFNETLRVDPNNLRAVNSRGNAWRGKGDDDDAIADYNEAIRRDGRAVRPIVNGWFPILI